MNYNPPLTPEQREARYEDLMWMLDNGESMDGAAHRLGLTRRSLDRFLADHYPAKITA